MFNTKLILRKHILPASGGLRINHRHGSLVNSKISIQDWNIGLSSLPNWMAMNC